jgi:hypothetical protein
MYAAERMPGTLSGIENFNITMYWNAIKDRIEDLRNLPTWCTNHAMKLGITVTNLRAKGRTDLVALLDTEIAKVNDDITRAWKVKGYVDTYAPQWLMAAGAAAQGPVISSVTNIPNAPVRPTTPVPSYTPPSAIEEVTGWFGSLFSGGGVSGIPERQGLGVLPIVLSAAALAALAYCVTTGMALYQDYVTKKDLTQAVIEGKMSSGQAADIIVASRPPEGGGVFHQIGVGVGTNIGTIAILAGIGYLGFMYLTQKHVAGKVI